MKRVLKIVLNVFAWVLLIFALLITILVFSSGRNNGTPSLFGLMPMTVESASMEPAFKVNDMIICKEVDDVYSLEKDDVITFWTYIEGQRVKNTHRIVEIKKEGSSLSFVTRGDNNALDDDQEVVPGDIVGKWTGFRLPGFGKVMDFLSTKTGFFICIIIPMALFFLFELYKFITTLIEIRKPKLTESDEEEIKRRAIEEYIASQKAAAGGENAPPAETPAPEAAPSPEAAKPVAEEVRPAPEEATPSAEAETPAAEKAAPSAEAETPTAEEATPSAEEGTPTAEQAAPSPEVETPAAEEAAPSAEAETPAADEAAPAEPPEGDS